MVSLLGWLCFVIPGLVAVTLFLKISEHRIDLRPYETPFHGSSRIAYRNVLKRSNYSIDGQRLYPWFLIALLATQVGALVAVIVWIWRG
jgi:hypothetical protein